METKVPLLARAFAPHEGELQLFGAVFCPTLDRIADRLDSATSEDRRRVLEALDTRITVTETGGLDISVGVPGRVDCVHQTQGQ